MNHITHSYSSTSSSFSSSNNRPSKSLKSTRPSYNDSLHSVYKPTSQKAIFKQFIAPLPPTPAKVYNVSSSKFKEVVRMLTSTPEFQSQSTRRLKDIAPPPLNLSTIPKPQPLSANFSKLLDETPDNNNTFVISNSPVMDYFGNLSPLEFTSSSISPPFDPFGVALMSPLGLKMSPTSLLWCSSLLLSPNNLTRVAL